MRVKEKIFMNKNLLRILISFGVAFVATFICDISFAFAENSTGVYGSCNFLLFSDVFFLCYPLGTYLREEHKEKKLFIFLGGLLRIIGFASFGLFLLWFLGGLATDPTPMSYMVFEDRTPGDNVLMVGSLAFMFSNLLQIFLADIWPHIHDNDTNVNIACNGQLLFQPLFLIAFSFISIGVDIRYLALLIFNIVILFIFLAYIASEGNPIGGAVMLAVPFLTNLFICIFAFGGEEGILANQFYFTCSAFFFLALIGSLIFWAIINWYMVDDSKGLFVLMVLVILLSFGLQFLILNQPMSVFFVVLGIAGLIILVRFLYTYFLAIIVAIGSVIIGTICPPILFVLVALGILNSSEGGGSSGGSGGRLHIKSSDGKVDANIVYSYIKDEIDRGFFSADADDLYDIQESGKKVIVYYNGGQYGTIMQSRIKDAIRNMRSDGYNTDNIELMVKH